MDQVINMSAFVQVVNVGSFTGAAKHLGISPASVTSRIQSFEQQLGIRLLNRTTRRVSLTEEGEAFYERCNRILAEIADVECLAGTLQSRPNGTLRVNTDIALARVVAPLVGEYAAQYPDVSCELIMTDRMANLIEKKFDLAIFAGLLRDSSLIARRLGVGRVALCAAPAYLARRKPPQHPKDLAHHNCLDLVNGFSGNHWRFVGKDGEHIVNAAGNLRSNSVEGLRAGALAGQGICLLPLSSVADDIERGDLVRLLPGYEVGTTIIQAVYPPGRHLSTKVRTFLDFLIKRLREPGPNDRKAVKAENETMQTRASDVPPSRYVLAQPSSAQGVEPTRVGATSIQRTNRRVPLRMVG
jgi:DNA-binding transcriptional LysR family regulator